MPMNPLELIEQFYLRDSLTYRLLVKHSGQVAARAKQIASRLALTTDVDIEFVSEAAWLHDIGIYLTDAPEMGCHGQAHYLAHGIFGAGLLRKAGLPRHARVCERHIGVGLTTEDILTQQLPLPARDMHPETIEEEIIAYADLFFSKHSHKIDTPRTPEMVRMGLARFGREKAALFDHWQMRFGD
jgi:uncharacterized protein